MTTTSSTDTPPTLADARDLSSRLGTAMAAIAVATELLRDPPVVALAMERLMTELRRQRAFDAAILSSASEPTADLPSGDRHARVEAAFQRPLPALFPPRAFDAVQRVHAELAADGNPTATLGELERAVATCSDE